MSVESTYRLVLAEHGDHLIVRLPQGHSELIVQSLQTEPLKAFNKIAPAGTMPNRSVKVKTLLDRNEESLKTLRNGCYIELSYQGTTFWEDQVVEVVDPIIDFS